MIIVCELYEKLLQRPSEHAAEIINCKKTKMLPLRKKNIENHSGNRNFAYMQIKDFLITMTKILQSSRSWLLHKKIQRCYK